MHKKIYHKWHSTGKEPLSYPNPLHDMTGYLVLRRYPGNRLDIDVEVWWDSKNVPRYIDPDQFCYYGVGKLLGWQPLPPPITEDPTGWLSEYRGDHNPDVSGWYLCTTTRDNRNFIVKKVFWETSKAHWSPGTLQKWEEVIAWREYPSIPLQRQVAP